MLSLSPIKILIILLVVLLVVGPDKLPQIARQVGGAWRALKGLSSRVEEEVRSSLPDLPSTGDLARYARSPATLLDRLAGMSGSDELKEDPGADGALESSEAPLQPDPAAPQPSPQPSAPASPAPTGATAVRPVTPQGVDPSLN
mgnify:CR=1 FL=1